jgi:hypothetical protein
MQDIVENLYPIKDSDLLEKLETGKGKAGFQSYQRLLSEMQKDRDEKAARYQAMTPIEIRRDKIREELQETPFEDSDRYHIHSILAMCGLPYKRPAEGITDYMREYGKSSLVVQAGYLKNPETGKMIKQGLPYGPKARLLLLHICTMALRQNSHIVEIEDSMSAFIRELGFPVSGGSRGTIGQFKEQLQRLAAARMQIGLWNGIHSKTINSQPIEAFDVWLPHSPNQKSFWNSTLQLDEKFFQSLKEHALPVDIRSLLGFTQSARQIDMLLWLGYRIRSLKRPYLIKWKHLQEQFGPEIITRERKFRQSFKEDLAAIQEVYPKLSVKLDENGLMLFQSDPEKLFVQPKGKLIR